MKSSKIVFLKMKTLCMHNLMAMVIFNQDDIDVD